MAGLLWVVLAPMQAKAGGITELYDRASLEYWRKLTPEDIEWNFRNVVLTVLTKTEKEKLGTVELEFPLVGAEDLEPFCFASRYPLDRSSATPSKVQMSMLSLRFFAQLSIAYGWLQTNGYLIDPVSDYVAMLKYRQGSSFPGGKYPPPLVALGIPEKGREEKAASESFEKIYKSAIVFILAHELGHIFHRHAGYGAGVSRERSRLNEEEADAFTLEVMRRIGVAPVGMVVYFMTHAHWTPNRWDFASEEKYRAYLAEATHPLTSQRLRTLAKRISEARDQFARKETNTQATVRALEFISTQISMIAGFLDDPDVQEGMATVGRTTDLAALKPRRPGELPLRAQPSKGGAASTEAFDGSFEGMISDASGDLRCVLLLERKGASVTGAYSYGLGMGTVNGRVENGILFYEWRSGGSSGKGKFESSDDAANIVGTWGRGDSREKGGKWIAKRADARPALISSLKEI